ncbi:MAG: hypothetical protein IKU13_06080, partial [Clostridia bacterium]|nr:hypothetical protein [Clostridia bacterium]
MKLNEKSDIKKALDTALLCGFTAESALFPIYTPGCEIAEVTDISPSALPCNYTPAPKTGPVFSTEFRSKIGLEGMLSEGLFLHDTDNDFLPDMLDGKIAFAQNPDVYTLAAAMNLAYRLGMETTAIEDSVYADNIAVDKVLTFTSKGSPEIILNGENKVTINGSGEELLTFISSLCNTFPKVNTVHTWRDELMKMTDDLCMKSADGQLAYASCHDGEFTVFSSPDMTEEQKARLPQVHFENHKSGKKVFSLDFEYVWEKDEFIRIFKENILPQLKKGDSLILEGAISEEAEIRRDVCDEIALLCNEKDVHLENIQLICAYKQGFSWLDEVVLPQLKCKNVENITIYFKPFLPIGETEWKDENGATPSYNNVGGGDENKWLDLPIRYLQELYPIEDVIVNTLKIDRNDVNFAVLDTDEDITYAVEADGMRFTYKAHASERPFMDEHKNMGKVHPSTGYIKAVINGKTAFESDVKTDLERIWDDYQTHVLPAVKTWCEEKYPDLSADDQPFFSKLELEISVSEPDYRLPSREDMISSLDAFHEDMYFLGGDYFKNYGKEKYGQMFDAPGLILPVIHNAQGKP